MLRKKIILRKILAMLMIVAIILPYTSEVFAIALTHEDTTIMLETSIEHEGGDEASNSITGYEDNYDKHQYSYQIANSASETDVEGRTTVFKIIKEGDYSFEDALFCLNAEKAFPSDAAQEYKNIGDLKDEMETAGASLINSIGAQNYQSVVWLIDNMYLRKAQPEAKIDFIKKAFANVISENTIPPVTAEYIASIITDDDIEVVQQWAIWYFTNGNNAGYSEDYAKYYNPKYSTFGTVYVSGMSTNGEYVSLNDLTGNGSRQELLNTLYSYLVDTAKIVAKSEQVTYPSFAVENANLTCTVDGDYYKVGPFNVTSGNAPETAYSIKLVDSNGEISREAYKILIEGEAEFTNLNVDKILDKNYYIHLPIENNTISKVKLTIDYTIYETEASLWSVQSDSTYQPVVLITRGENIVSDSREKDIETKEFDLTLRKYIIKAGTKDVLDRLPDVIIENDIIEYKHKKEPVVLVSGETVVYEIRVFNEGTLPGIAKQITDYLPVGMTLADTELNKIYEWKASEDGRTVTTNFLDDVIIDAYDGEGEPDSEYVQIECIIADNIADEITSNLVLTNVAEITEYSRKDKDSSKSIDPSTINTETYTGNKTNKEDLSDSEYYYKGLEDDDDFEKVVIEPKEEIKTFDLSLKKFVSKINGKTPSISREPKVDVTNLKNGSSTNAVYTQTKTALEVKKGDIVTYTLRVYNEGELGGYAEKVSDYLPSGLGYLMNYNKNIENKWVIPTDAQITKLAEIENATKNLKEEDFTSDFSLENEIVVIGGGKFTSTAISSSETSTENLIKAFNKENGTALEYKDIEITCVVLTDIVENNNLRNIAEISKVTDENRTEIADIDSKVDSVDPNNYPDAEKENNNGKEQDDHDYEKLKNPLAEEKYFSLALQKFVTSVNSEKITNREPVVTKNEDGTFRYSHTSEALAVANKDLVTYTIRVYNEGDLNGYASEIMDNIPSGLTYLPDNEVNKNYGWKMYDKNGAETKDVNQAVSVKTSYLSKENGKIDESAKPEDYTPEKYPYYTANSNMLLAYDSEIMDKPHYRDIQIVFKISEAALKSKTEREIVNISEITDDQDENGKEIDDKDSIPGNNKEGEDDLDKEKVKVKYFDLALKKTLAKIIITENGKTREIIPANEKDLLKVEINRKYISSTTVKFVYNIIVTNEGEIAGYAKEVKDYIPNGFVFKQADNPNWTAIESDCIKTEALANTLIEPGKNASVQVTLQWNNAENNMGEKINVAEISKDENTAESPDIDSTPDNKKADEDDQDDAPVILSVATGKQPIYVVLSTTVLTILATGIILIKKYVLI